MLLEKTRLSSTIIMLKAAIYQKCTKFNIAMLLALMMKLFLLQS